MCFIAHTSLLEDGPGHNDWFPELGRSADLSFQILGPVNVIIVNGGEGADGS